MADNNIIITLIGSRVAKEGEEFIFLGESRECEKCKLKRTCLNLESGRRYKVMKVRSNTVHDCFIHDGGVLAAEVESAPVLAAIDSKKAVEGAKISYEKPKCEEYDDAVYDLMNPEGVRDQDKCTVVKVLGNVDGESVSGCSLKKVELKV